LNLKQLIKFYENRVIQLNEDLERYEDEWEAWPSGEMNESQVPINLCQMEIETIEEILEDLRYMKYEKPRRSFYSKRRKWK